VGPYPISSTNHGRLITSHLSRFFSELIHAVTALLVRARSRRRDRSVFRPGSVGFGVGAPLPTAEIKLLVMLTHRPTVSGTTGLRSSSSEPPGGCGDTRGRRHSTRRFVAGSLVSEQTHASESPVGRAVG